MKHPAYPAIEPLESRIAPALAVLHPIPDIVPGVGQTGATLDLGNAFDAAGNFRTHVQFTTNYIDPLNPAQPQIIELELFDDKAPVTVANFLRYVNGLAPSDFNDVFFHRSVAGFVLQGGGFATDAPGSHIAIDPEVHNEFTAGDAERSNLAGTVAMAKTGLGPHTATSEWFFNLGNNAGNLDNQNGGFTVFAKVTQGMNVVNAIAALGTRNLSSLNGALTNVPVQNYNPDPDNNPATPPPTPTAAQFLAITHANVIAPTPANAAGIGFSVVSITDPVTQAATDLVTGALTGQSLQLQYKAGASGVAKVTVKASKAGETDVLEDFLVTVKPNLIVSITGDALPQVILPGDKANVGVQLTNSGAASSGNFDVKIHLSKTTAPAFDAVIGTLTNQSIASGASVSVAIEAGIPQSLLLQQGQSYRVTAEVVPSASGIELFSDDNVNVNSQQGHTLYNLFGSFSVQGVGGRSNAHLTYLDANGETVTATLTGGGFGLFDPNFDGSTRVLSVRFTSADSVLSVTTGNPGAQTPLNAISVDAVLGTAALGNVALTGDFAALGGIKTLTLGSIGVSTATHTLTIGAFAADATQKTTLSLGQVRDVALTSSMPIAALNAVSWLDTNSVSHEVITAPSIDTVFITGDATRSGALQAGFGGTLATSLQSFKLGYLDTTNQPLTLTVSGGGYGQFDPQRNGSVGVLEVSNTTAASNLSLVGANGSVQTQLDNIRIVAPLGTAALGNLTLKNSFEALSGVRSLTIGDSRQLQSFRLGYLDPASQPVTLTITGGGYGQFDPLHDGSVGSLKLSDTSATSALSLVAANAAVRTQLDKISIAAPMGTAALGNLTLKGDFEAIGGIKTLTLGNVGDGIGTHMFSIGAFAADPAQKAALTLGQVRDVALASAMPLASLSAVDWLDSNASNELIALTAIDSFLIRGDATHAGAFQADLTVTGTTKLLAFTVTGTMSDSRVQIAGDVGTVKLGSLVRSDFLVGVTSVPHTLGDFGLIKHKIDKFKIANSTGIPLNDSRIAAAKFGSISVGKVKGASGTADFGFIADRIASYQVGAVTKSGLDAPRKFDRHGHYVTRIV